MENDLERQAHEIADGTIFAGPDRWRIQQAVLAGMRWAASECARVADEDGCHFVAHQIRARFGARQDEHGAHSLQQGEARYMEQGAAPTRPGCASESERASVLPQGDETPPVESVGKARENKPPHAYPGLREANERANRTVERMLGARQDEQPPAAAGASPASTEGDAVKSEESSAVPRATERNTVDGSNPSAGGPTSERAALVDRAQNWMLEHEAEYAGAEDRDEMLADFALAESAVLRKVIDSDALVMADMTGLNAKLRKELERARENELWCANAPDREKVRVALKERDAARTQLSLTTTAMGVARSEADAARATNRELNRRAQKAEAGLAEKIEASGRSMGRALANSAAAVYLRERDAARADLAKMWTPKDDDLMAKMVEITELRAENAELRKELEDARAVIAMPTDTEMDAYRATLTPKDMKRHEAIRELVVNPDLLDRLRTERDTARKELAATQRAKAENDERFMLERDEARAEVERRARAQEQKP